MTIPTFGDVTKITRYNSLFKEWFTGTPYNYGIGEPHYPVPAIPTEVHYNYDSPGSLFNGVVVRVRGVAKVGYWDDGTPFEPLPEWVCQFCGGGDHKEENCPLA